MSTFLRLAPFASCALPGSIAVLLASCGPAAVAPQPEPVAAAPVSANLPTETSSVPGDPKSCERDEAGQTQCLITAFGLTRCGDSAVLGSMFRDNAKEGSYQHRTAFGIDALCLDNLREAAVKRGLRKNERGEFTGDLGAGYDELLVIGLQISTDGTVIEWERNQE